MASAIATAVRRLPTPGGPASSTAGGIESRAITRESSDRRREWPTIVRNGTIALSQRRKILPQKPRLRGCESEVSGVDAAGAAAGGALSPRRVPAFGVAGSCRGSAGANGAVAVPEVAATAGPIFESPDVVTTSKPLEWSGQYSVGSVPRTKYSVYSIERSVGFPSRSKITADSHPAVGSLPLSRQIVTGTTDAGIANLSGLSFRVATAMNRPQSGTASSPA